MIIIITLVGRGVKVCELFFLLTTTTTTQFSRRFSTFGFYHTSHQIISHTLSVDWVSIEKKSAGVSHWKECQAGMTSNYQHLDSVTGAEGMVLIWQRIETLEIEN